MIKIPSIIRRGKTIWDRLIQSRPTWTRTKGTCGLSMKSGPEIDTVKITNRPASALPDIEVCSRVKPMQPGFDILQLEDGTKIGKVQYFINDTILGESRLPPEWFRINEDGTKVLKPYLWLEHISIDNKGKGLGREAMKRLYMESVQRGCEGRMLCHTAWGSHGFYAKTGWETYGMEFCLNKFNAQKEKCLKMIEELKLDPSKKAELEKYESDLKFCEDYIKKIQTGRPFKEDNIMFNPTETNLRMLFNG